MFIRPTFLNRSLVIMIIASLLSTSLFAILQAQAAPLVQSQSVTFPAQPYEGLQITFTISGASLGAAQDIQNSSPFAGFSRLYDNAALSGGPVKVTGYATGEKGAYGYLQARLTGSTEPPLQFSDTSGEAWKQEFSFTVPNPEQYSYLVLNIIIQRFSQYDSIGINAEINNPGNLVTPTPTQTPVPVTGKMPCGEAVLKYALDPNQPTQMQYDYADLQKQFEQALKKYEANNARAYAQDNILGTLPALSWLANQGGTINAINKQFVFTSDADREKWKNKIPRASQVTPGNERALYEAMYATAKNGKKLTPGDVFYLALVQRGGDAKGAMLLAHNTLRSLSRIADSIFTDSDQTLTQVEWNPSFISEYFAPLISPEPLGVGQNNGAWYHLFGVAYFEMQARGTWGAYTLVQLTGDASMEMINQKLGEMLKVLKQDPELKVPTNQSLYSDLANETEQLARKYIFLSPDDPMKYCYNVWGAQLGAWLYRNRLAIKPALQLPPSPPRGVTIPTIFGPMPLDSRPTGDSVDKNNPDTWISSSPMKITWENSQYKMVLDQQSNSLYGYFPVNVFPMYEQDTNTWGMVWVQTGSDDYRITLEATQDGWAHLTRSNSGQTQVYPIALKAGDKLTLDTSASQPTPALVRSNGNIITPIDLTPASNNSSGSSGACTRLEISRASWLARDASGQQLYEVGAYPSGTKEIIPAFVYPCAPSSATIITQISRDGKSVDFNSDLAASDTADWFYLPIAFDTAFDDGLYNVSFYVNQTLLGSGQVRIGGEFPTSAAMVTVNGLVLDSATQKPLAKAWVAVLLPGIAAADWQKLEFSDDAVLAYGQSDSQGQFSLVDPVDMQTPVYLERNTAYSIFAWLEGYQNVLADGVVIDDSQSNPVKVTIKMQR